MVRLYDWCYTKIIVCGCEEGFQTIKNPILKCTYNKKSYEVTKSNVHYCMYVQSSHQRKNIYYKFTLSCITMNSDYVFIHSQNIHTFIHYFIHTTAGINVSISQRCVISLVFIWHQYRDVRRPIFLRRRLADCAELSDGWPSESLLRRIRLDTTYN